jgi:hypothetical protein
MIIYTLYIIYIINIFYKYLMINNYEINDYEINIFSIILLFIKNNIKI